MAGRESITREDRSALLANQMHTTIENLSLVEGHAVIIGGAVIQLYGLRMANDIDILVSPSFYNFIKKHKIFKASRGYTQSDGLRKPISVELSPLEPRYKPEFDTKKRMHCFLQTKFDDDKFPMTFEEALEHVDTIDGIAALALSQVRQWKQAVGRRKDLHDIELIDTFKRD